MEKMSPFLKMLNHYFDILIILRYPLYQKTKLSHYSQIPFFFLDTNSFFGDTQLTDQMKDN